MCVWFYLMKSTSSQAQQTHSGDIQSVLIIIMMCNTIAMWCVVKEYGVRREKKIELNKSISDVYCKRSFVLISFLLLHHHETKYLSLPSKLNHTHWNEQNVFFFLSSLSSFFFFFFCSRSHMTKVVSINTSNGKS